MSTLQIKKLSKEGIPKALAKAERYRLLTDPSTAEGICRDIVAVDPGNQEALIMLILTLTDQFKDPMHRINIKQAQDLIPQLGDAYQKQYYQGIICERWAKALLHRGAMGSETMAYDFLMQGLEFFKQAESQHPTGNDEALLHWNSCLRCIQTHKLVPPAAGDKHSRQYHD